jgi:hypothetical protein
LQTLFKKGISAPMDERIYICRRSLYVNLPSPLPGVNRQNTMVDRQVIIPAYTLLDVSIFYDQPKYRIGFKVDKLTSEKAWSVKLTPQAPVRFIGNMSLKF